MVDEIKNVNSVNINGNQSIDFAAGQTAGNKVSIFEEMLKKYEAQLGRPLKPEEVAIMVKAIEQGTVYTIASALGATFTTGKPVLNGQEIQPQPGEPVAEGVSPDVTGAVVQEPTAEVVETAVADVVAQKPETPQEDLIQRTQGTLKLDKELAFGTRTQTTAEEQSVNIDGQEYDGEYLQLFSMTDLEGKTSEQINQDLAMAYARNKYIFSDLSENESYEIRNEEWKSKSDAEKEELANGYLELVSKRLPDYNVIELNAAIWQNDTIDVFNEKSEEEKRTSMLAALAYMKSEKKDLTEAQETLLQSETLRLEVYKQALIDNKLYKGQLKSGMEYLWQDDLDSLMNSVKELGDDFNYGAAYKEYVTSGKYDDKLKEIFSGDEQKITNLKKEVSILNPEEMKDIGIKLGQKTDLQNIYEESLKPGTDEFEKYSTASEKERMKMMMLDRKNKILAAKTPKEIAEASKEFEKDIEETFKTGNEDERKALMALLPELPQKFVESIATTDNKFVMVAVAQNLDKMGAYAGAALDNIAKKEPDFNYKNEWYKIGVNNRSEEQAPEVAAATVRNEKNLSKSTIEYAIDDLQKGKGDHYAIAQEFNKFENSDYIFFSVQNSTTIKDNAEAQRIYFNTGIEGHPEIAPRAIPLVKDLLAENQASGFQTTQNAIEGSSLSDEDKIRYGKMLGNQVEFLDKSAQLEAHTSLTNSQFHEVAAYAAGNIYRYDASVQSGAIDVSFAAAQSTGNTAIYEAIAQHYSQLAPETQSHIESNPSYYTPLHELAGVHAAEDKSLYTEWHDNQNKEFWYNKERHESAKEKFFREWQELTPAQKYERMCNFFKHKTKFALASKNLRSLMFSYAKSDPVFLKALVQSLGVSILECSDLPTEVRSMAAKVLMQDPAQRKSVAQKVLDAGPGVYNNSLIKYCAEYLAKQDDNITNIQSFNNLSTLQKTEVLKNSGNNNPSDEMTYVGIGTQRGSDKNNRPYLSNDFFKKKANLRELEEWIKNGI